MFVENGSIFGCRERGHNPEGKERIVKRRPGRENERQREEDEDGDERKVDRRQLNEQVQGPLASPLVLSRRKERKKE